MTPDTPQLLKVLADYGFAIFVGVVLLALLVWGVRLGWRALLLYVEKIGAFVAEQVAKFLDTHLKTQRRLSKSVEALSGTASEQLTLTRDIHRRLVTDCGTSEPGSGKE